MPYTLIFTVRYTRIAARFLKRHPDMTRAYEKTLALLQVNPHHPSLRLHQRGGRLEGVHSVSINPVIPHYLAPVVDRARGRAVECRRS